MCLPKPTQHMLTCDLCAGLKEGAPVGEDGQGCQPWPSTSPRCSPPPALLGFRLVMVWLHPRSECCLDKAGLVVLGTVSLC